MFWESLLLLRKTLLLFRNRQNLSNKQSFPHTWTVWERSLENSCSNSFGSVQVLICWTLYQEWGNDWDWSRKRMVIVAWLSAKAAEPRPHTPYSISPPSRGLSDSSQADFKALGAAGRESQRPAPFFRLCHTHKLWFSPFLLLRFFCFYETCISLMLLLVQLTICDVDHLLLSHDGTWDAQSFCKRDTRVVHVWSFAFI